MNKILQLSVFSIMLLIPAGSQNVLAGNGCVPPPSDMISWWPGDGNAADIVDSNPGVLENGASFAAGKVGSAFSFDGVDDTVRVTHNPNQNVGAEITVDAWVNQDVAGHGQSIINKRTSMNLFDGGFTFETTHSPSGPDNGLQFGIGAPQDVLITAAGVLTTDVFHHVAATYDGSMMRIYVDGVEVASKPSLVGNIDPISADIEIGRNSVIPAFAFNGIIDEVELFNRALSAPEIQAIFDAGPEGKCKTPIEPTPVVGGELLSIDNTALLLAGAQSTSWMIPVVLSVLGIGLFVVSRKSDNS